MGNLPNDQMMINQENMFLYQLLIAPSFFLKHIPYVMGWSVTFLSLVKVLQ